MVPVIGIASGLGASMEGSSFGPSAIQKAFQENVHWKTIFSSNSQKTEKNKQILTLNQDLAQEVFNSVIKEPLTLVIGGDHSCAIGTWSGVSEALHKKNKTLALLWIDAHMDSHTPESTPSGNIHGMPLATLLGHGDPQFTNILSKRAKVKPENVFLIGIRSYEPEEKALIEKLGIRVYYIEEVHKRGLNAIFSEIKNYLASHQLSYGISLDIDFFDPSEMSATGTPVENGAHPLEFIQNYEIFKDYPPVAFEFVEFNPSQDMGPNSLKWTKKILKCVVTR